jgi:hypothetical protein
MLCKEIIYRHPALRMIGFHLLHNRVNRLVELGTALCKFPLEPAFAHAPEFLGIGARDKRRIAIAKGNAAVPYDAGCSTEG